MMATAACRSGAGRGGNGGSGLRSTDDFEQKRSMTKLKRKHVPSEPGAGGGEGDVATLDLNAASSTNLVEITAARNSATFTTPNRSSSSATSSTSSSKSTLKRVFNIAESPTCKSEARSVDDDVIAASRFQPLQGLIF